MLTVAVSIVKKYEASHRFVEKTNELRQNRVAKVWLITGCSTGFGRALQKLC